MKSNILPVFGYCTVNVVPKNRAAYSGSQRFILFLPKAFFFLDLTFRSVIRFELNFVCVGDNNLNRV